MYLKIEFTKKQNKDIEEIWDIFQDIVNKKYIKETKFDEETFDDFLLVNLYYYNDEHSYEQNEEELEELQSYISSELNSRNIKYFWRD